MTADEYAELKAECDRRNFNITQIVALANIMPKIGCRKITYGNSKCPQYELTYCGKSRKEWNRVKRHKLTPYERSLIRDVEQTQ